MSGPWGIIVSLTGAVLVVVNLVDVVWTTVASGSGAGPVTGLVSSRLWKLLLVIHRRRRSHGLLSTGAIALTFLLLGMWVVVNLLGWWLVVLPGEGAIVSTQTGAAASPVDRLYFTGYTVFTLGIGDFRPAPGTWQVITIAMTATGLVLISLSITYLIPLASAQAENRRLGSFIHSLGPGPEAIVTRGWDGRGFGPLQSHLLNLAPLLHGARQTHLTYPILHYFHPADPRSALPPNLVDLALALLVLDTVVDPDARPHELTTRSCREAINSFLETLEGAHIEPTSQPVPMPDLGSLTDVGIPLAAEADVRKAAEASIRSRSLLAGLLKDTGW